MSPSYFIVFWFPLYVVHMPFYPLGILHVLAPITNNLILVNQTQIATFEEENLYNKNAYFLQISAANYLSRRLL